MSEVSSEAVEAAPRVAPSVEEVRDELSGWPIGSGYYATQVGTDEARDMADAVLALFASQPTVGRCARCGKPVIVPADDPDNEAGECCPSCTNEVCDAAVRVVPSADEVAELRRRLATAEAVVRDLQREPTVAQVREQVARELKRFADCMDPAFGPLSPSERAAIRAAAGVIARGETKGGE